MLPYSDQQKQPNPYASNNVTPDYCLEQFLDESFFDRPLTSVEGGYPAKTQTTFNPTLPPTGLAASRSNPTFQQQPFNPSNFTQFEQTYNQNFSLDPSALENSAFSPTTTTTHTFSRTPSLCGDAPSTQQQILHSPSLSPRIPLKREFPEDSPVSVPTSTDDPSTKLARKRGRPRLDRTRELPSPPSSSATSSRTHRPPRLPHNQVERKYREGLNSELEKLREAVPTLRRSAQDGALAGTAQPKPSKAMVLSSAIEYIHQVESERDALLAEVERLRREGGGMDDLLSERW